MLKDNKQNWMKYRFKKTVSIKEAIKSHKMLIKKINSIENSMPFNVQQGIEPIF